MAKTSAIEKNKRRQAIAERLKSKRAAIVAVLRDPTKTLEERDDAARKLARMPRDSNRDRFRNRCLLTGRPRAYLRKFGLCRIQFRDLASLAEIPGVRKASW